MNEELRKLQDTELEILSEIDQFCRRNNIPYSLYAGTLLGAIRHKGFIPWDDDLDICMSRENYNRFLSFWNQEQPSGYVIQNKENTPTFTQSFSKIRKDHTTFLQYEWERNLYHTGIFVDIFPLDRFPKGKFKNLIFKFDCMKYQLYTREFVPGNANFVVKCISTFFLKTSNHSNRVVKRYQLLKRITRYDGNTENPVAAIETMSSLSRPFPSNMLDDYSEIEFEGKKFMCFSDWDEHLKCKFGSYMELPPESERTWTHHPIIIDFDKNYEEINDRNK